MKKYAWSLLSAFVLCSHLNAQEVDSLEVNSVTNKTSSTQESNNTLTKEELAEIQKKLNNPLADLWLLFLQNDYLSYKDAQDNKYQLNSLKFQPVMSFDISKDYNLIVRPTIQHMSIEAPGLERDSGLGDTGVLVALGPKADVNGWIIGGGLTSMFPTAKEKHLTTLGADQTAIGPALVALNIGKENTFGAVIQHFEGVGSSNLRNINGQEEDIKLTDFQYIYRHKISSTTQIGFAPNIQIDWNKKGSDRFSVPIGFGIDKTTMFGKMPVRIGVEAYYYVHKNDEFGPDFGLRFFAIPVVPSFF